MDRKIKVLCVPSDNGGCGLHRSLMPHLKLNELYGNEFDIKINYNPNWGDLEYINSYDIIHFHKGCYSNLQEFHTALDFCKKNNIVTIMDIDDNWNLGQKHPLHHIYKQNNIDKIIIDNLKRADYITTTTHIFANVIKKINPNVKIYPNVIDDNRIAKLKSKKSSNKIRFGFVMGSTHKNDMDLIEGLTNRLSPDILDKIQFVLCGYDLKGKMTEFHPDGSTTVRDMHPKEIVWYDYERNITDDYKIVSPEYRDFLLKFIPDSEYPFVENEKYRRCWTKTVDEYKYMEHYNEIDVLLIPLEENDFNVCKSELKFIEAGMMDTAVIASNFGPYTIGSKNFFEKGGIINEDGNCILIDNRKAHKEWAKAIEKLVKNPDYIEKLQKNMKKHVSENYDMNKITAERAEWYRKICKKNGETNK